jgi:hypothetical protein
MAAHNVEAEMNAAKLEQLQLNDLLERLVDARLEGRREDEQMLRREIERRQASQPCGTRGWRGRPSAEDID